MATTEERLAALEAKMAQLTDTRPTTYYTHQYSGEEIDAATGRALTGGALDTSVTNVSNQLGTFVRPNLLDNWYFGRPVDQRGGKIIQQGKMAYRDAACTIEAGGVSETAMTVTKVSDTVYTFKGGDGSPYYVKAADVVRGYTGNGYTVDRWLCAEPSTVMEITDGGIHVSYTQPGWNVIQKLENVLHKGNTYTFSAIYKSTNPLRLVVNWGDNKYFFNESSPATSEWALVTITGTVPNDAEITYEQVVFQSLGAVAGTMDIKACKLELGPTQTLARWEGDKWVLNEVPEYGEQLRRCQRYYQVDDCTTSYTVVAHGIAASPTYWRGLLPVHVDMRTKPTISLIGDNISAQLIGNNQSISVSGLSLTVVDSSPAGTAISLNGVVGLIQNQNYALQLYRCKIIRSADL